MPLDLPTHPHPDRADITPDLNAPIIFESLEPIEVPVRLGKVDYVLREISGGDAAKFRNQALKYARYDPSGRITQAGDIGNLEPFLVSLCLWKLEPDGKKERVPEIVVRGWKASIVSALFARAKAISRLDEDREEETVDSVTKKIDELQRKLALLRNGHDTPREVLEKNSSSSTEDGSDTVTG